MPTLTSQEFETLASGKQRFQESGGDIFGFYTPEGTRRFKITRGTTATEDIYEEILPESGISPVITTSDSAFDRISTAIPEITKQATNYAYFVRTPEGLAGISDPGTLRKILSGEIQTTKLPSLGREKVVPAAFVGKPTAGQEIVGVSTEAPTPTPTQPPPTLPTRPPEEQAELDTWNQIIEGLNRERDALNQYNDPYADPSFSNYLSVFNRQFDDLRKQTEEYNLRVEALQEKMGIISGTQRYSPLVAGGEVLQRAQEGLRRINDLETKRRETILSAYDDLKAKRWDRMIKKYDIAIRMRDNVISEFKARTERMKAETEALAKSFELTAKAQEREEASYASIMASIITGDPEQDAALVRDFADDYGFDPTNLSFLQNTLGKALEIKRKQTKEQGQWVTEELPGVGIVQTNQATGERRVLSTREREVTYIDPLTGEIRVLHLGGAGGISGISGVAPPQPEAPTVPPQLQPAIGKIGDIVYFDASKLTAKQIPIAQNLSTQLGIPFVSAKDAGEVKKQAKDVATAINLLDSIRNLARKVITAKTVQQRVAQGIQLRFEQLKGENPDVVSFFDAIEAFSSLLTRAAGEKGVLTNLDIARIKKALPRGTMTVQAMENNLKTLQDLFESNLEGAIRAYLGNQFGVTSFGSVQTGGVSTTPFGTTTSGKTSSGIGYTIE